MGSFVRFVRIVVVVTSIAGGVQDTALTSSLQFNSTAFITWHS